MALPAAATNRIPRVRCATIASLSAWESSPPPQELLEATRLTPRSFMSATYSRQVIASAVVPLPLESRNLHARIETFQLTPLTPTALLQTAPIVPATCVPWK